MLLSLDDETIGGFRILDRIISIFITNLLLFIGLYMEGKMVASEKNKIHRSNEIPHRREVRDDEVVWRFSFRESCVFCICK